jgi:hypothetical protein
MKQKWIKIMKETNRLKLSRTQLFWYYSISPLIMIVLIISSYFSFQAQVNPTFTEKALFFLIIGLLLLILLFIKVLILYRSLKFERLKAKLSGEEFKLLVMDTVDEMNWNFIELNEDYAVAESGKNSLIWGERITIVRKENEILINSISGSEHLLSGSKWFQNRKNINAFKKRIKP